ncbi:uncharacterized protein LOC143032022 [Oratosquilla oratoria]|uniref:uncharacterized protein LOC143032022 n=1 Tax=Oratosquilla oratoria TaxID=337810 RepID=UPI003F75E2A2
MAVTQRSCPWVPSHRHHLLHLLLFVFLSPSILCERIPGFYDPAELPEPSSVIGASGEKVLLREKRQRNYGVTNSDLSNHLKSLESKLNRHEYREVQVADHLKKTLKSIKNDQGQIGGKLQRLGSKASDFEDRLIALEQLIITVDERQRLQLAKISAGLDRLVPKSVQSSDFALFPPQPPGLPPRPDDDGEDKDLKKVIRKVNTIDENLKIELTNMNNEVRIVGETLQKHMERLNERHERLWSAWNTYDSEGDNNIREITNILRRTNDQLKDQINVAMAAAEASSKSRCSSPSSGVSEDVSGMLSLIEKSYQDQRGEMHNLADITQNGLERQSETLKMLLEESNMGQRIMNGSFADIKRDLKHMTQETASELKNMEKDVLEALTERIEVVKSKMVQMTNVVLEGHRVLEDMMDETGSQAEILQKTVLENYGELSKEIRGLHRVEQVMVNTADSVLDTKRSIEFGIQQIIFELGELVKNSGKTINSTLSDQISNVSFAILKNQTSALTNMTQKMESEISQVWRQIGIMYQQMAQSVNLLDKLQNTTNHQVSASLNKVGSTEGTVDNNSEKIADVENNLKQLLGRLSLVVSEFNYMKTGVGEELKRMRESMDQGRKEKFQVAEGDTEGNQYNVNQENL